MHQQETHINAYYTELAEAEQEMQGLKSKIETLKTTIKERGGTVEQSPKPVEPGNANEPVKDSVAAPKKTAPKKSANKTDDKTDVKDSDSKQDDNQTSADSKDTQDSDNPKEAKQAVNEHLKTPKDSK